MGLGAAAQARGHALEQGPGPEHRETEGHLPRGPVRAHQGHARLGDEGFLAGVVRRARPHQVDDGGVRGDGRPTPERAGAQAEIRLLPIHPVAQVEAAERAPGLQAHEQEAPHDDVHLADGVARPGPDPLRVEPLAALEGRTQAGRHAHGAPGGDALPARGGVQGSVREDGATAPDPCLWPAAGEGEQPVDGVVQHLGVRIEEEEVLAARPLRREVVGPREAQVLVGADQGEAPPELLLDRVGRAVVRGVVDHQQLEGPRLGLVEHRPQGRQGQVLRAVADDDDRDEGGGHGRARAGTSAREPREIARVGQVRTASRAWRAGPWEAREPAAPAAGGGAGEPWPPGPPRGRGRARGAGRAPR